MTDRSFGFLVRFILSIVIVFPLGLAVVCALPNFFGGWGLFWQGHDYAYYFLPNIVRHLPLGLPLAAIWIGFFIWLCRRQWDYESKYLGLKLFLVVLFSRGILVLVLGQFISLISDFAFSWDRACTGMITPANDAHVFFPAWMNFSMFQRLWVLVFGSNVGIGLLPGVFLNAITALLIFHYAVLAFENRKVAFVSSLLYALYSASMVYALTPACEHFSNAFFMGAALLCAKTMAEKVFDRRGLLFCAVAGIVAGIGNSVKPVFPIYAVAMAMCLGLVLLRNHARHRLCFSVAGLVLFVVFESCTLSIITRCTELVFDVSLRDKNPTPHYFCVGLNRQGEGQIQCGDLSRTWNRLVAMGEPFDVATQKAYEIVKKDWVEHPNDVLPFFMKKFVWTWQDDNRPFGMAMLHLGKKFGDKVLDGDDKTLMAQTTLKRELGEVNEDAKKVKNAVPSFRARVIDYCWQSIQTAGFVVYFIVMLTAVCSVVWVRGHAVARIPYVLTCLIVIGFWCLLAISEAASRYKCLVMPYVFILVSPFLTALIHKNETSR